MKTRTLPINCIRLLASILMICFALLPTAQAVSPPPDGGYPGGNTAEGENTLLGLTTGSYNSAFGFDALLVNSDGSFNTAIGAGALLLNNANENTAIGAGALLNNMTGADNTANGAFALFNNTSGSSNAAVGVNALLNNTEGSSNSAFGWAALASNTTSGGNTAVGAGALFSNTIGSSNTANGSSALYYNTDGENNTAIGAGALFSNTSGFSNTATGSTALLNNTTGHNNTAIGNAAMPANTTGENNTVCGSVALFLNTGGNNNTAVGRSALVNNTVSSGNTAIGRAALFNNTGAGNTALGYQSGYNVASGNDNIHIGNQGLDTDDTTIRIGDNQTTTFIAGIRGVTTGINDAINVVIDSSGQLGTQSSSRRYKTDVRSLDRISESILALKPVSFRYKVHKDATRQFGLIAEEVAEVNPDLVIYDHDGKPYTVRYDAVNAMLLNEFLKEHKKTEKLEATVANLIATVKEQATQIRKVSAQLEASRSASQVVANDQ